MPELVTEKVQTNPLLAPHVSSKETGSAAGETQS